jgi:hypothetical protein
MCMRFKKLLVLAALISSMGVAFAEEPHISLQNSSGISVDVNPSSGFYSVKYRSERWMGDGFVSVLANGRWYRSAAVIYPEASVYKTPDGRLSLQDKKTGSDSDRLGSFDYVNLTWKIPDIGTRLITGFRLYRDKPYLVFTQEFPDGFKNYSSGDWTLPSVAFPEFMPSMDSARDDLYSWISGGMFSHRFAYGSASSLGGTVDIMLLTDKDLDTLILSPLTNYLVATQQSEPVAPKDETEPAKAAIACGIEGLIQNLPVGFKHEHIMVVGDGVTKTINQWGQALLDKSGKKVPSKYDGDNLKYPTYWDDYGSYYREHGFKEDGYKTYEDIILGVAADAKKNDLKIGAYEITDSDQIRFAEGLFEPRADLFPHGLKWLHEQLGAPLIAYIPWLAPGGPYRSKYPYFETPKGNTIGAFPGSMGDVFYSESFWKDTANKLVDWGVIELQQDFLSTYSGDPVMMADLNRMNVYLKNQAKALQDKGLTMQYCMGQPRNIMESTENPIVTGLQATHDHHAPMAEPKPQHVDEDPYSWKHVIFTSAIYGAVGLWPSRDNIQTMADANAWEDILLANLMGGEIQLGHRIGEANVDLIRKTYRDGDGLVLKPDHPMAPLDRCYIEQCAVAWTSSEIDSKKWIYLLSLPYSGHLDNLSMDDLHLGGHWAVYDYDKRSLSLVDNHTSIPLRQDVKHEYLVAAPILPNGMAVLGDVSKFVTMADERIASVKTSENGVDIGIIANNARSPVIAGYSENRPGNVASGGQNLPEQASLDRLEHSSSGWFWDQQTRLWYVKVDFGTDSQMRTLVFRVS